MTLADVDLALSYYTLKRDGELNNHERVVMAALKAHLGLLEALTLATEYLRRVEGTIPRDPTGANVCTPDLRKCEAALAKARGEA
jgi:hypothetical protein